MSNSKCRSCGGPLPVKVVGRPAKFCSNACRQRSYRSRKGSGKLAGGKRWVRAVGKRPVTVSGASASSTDPNTWATYSEVRKSTVGDGFGVMLGGGLGCYDLDKCLVGDTLEDWAKNVVRNIPEEIVFAERSMSGTGLHIFFRAAHSGPGTKRGGVERYTQTRFIRTTLNKVDLSMLL